jgi:putative phosphoribosyl transferase
MTRPYPDRASAGEVLAGELAAYAGRSDVVVLALPRGGVPVGYEVAKRLGAPLDVFLVRKLGAPGQEELAMGAIASGDVVVLNPEVVQALKVPRDELKQEVERERQELARREQIYRGSRPALDVAGKTAILIDDGLATGSTMRAAVAALKRRDPARIVVAVPVGARSTCDELRSVGDDCICVLAPEHFRAVGLWYDNFEQISDDEVCYWLNRAAEKVPPSEASGGAGTDTVAEGTSGDQTS